MRTYQVRTSRQADLDIENLHSYIVETCKSPQPSKNYIQGIYSQIVSLKYSAESFPISTRTSVLKYGFHARCVYYKKMTIIYTVHKNIVLIQRVIPGAFIR